MQDYTSQRFAKPTFKAKIISKIPDKLTRRQNLCSNATHFVATLSIMKESLLQGQMMLLLRTIHMNRR